MRASVSAAPVTLSMFVASRGRETPSDDVPDQRRAAAADDMGGLLDRALDRAHPQRGQRPAVLPGTDRSAQPAFLTQVYAA